MTEFLVDLPIGWLLLAALTVIGVLAFALGRARALSQSGAGGRGLHSLTNYYGWFAALWAVVPALMLLFCYELFSGRLENQLVRAHAPAAFSQMAPERQELFINQAEKIAFELDTLKLQGLTLDSPKEERTRVALADAAGLFSGEADKWPGGEAEILSALTKASQEVRVFDGQLKAGVIVATLLLALGLLAIALIRIKPNLWARNKVEGWVMILLIACSAFAVLITVGIIFSVLGETIRFFQVVPIQDFLFGLQWSPQTAIRADQVGSSGAFGAVPLFAGTFLVMVIAMVVAVPIGLNAAIYLSEYASEPFRRIGKPVLEILAGIPTVVYGFFAALTVGPFIRDVCNSIGMQFGIEFLTKVEAQSALAAGLVMGIMIIPFVSSLSDDVINAVPQSLRDGSYAMGATKSETVRKVILPAALPGIVGSILLAVSRAVGETMIVVMAGLVGSYLTWNPLEKVTTITVQIVALLTGDLEFDSPKTLSAFALGFVLFLVTLLLNVIALRVVQTYREKYD